MHCHSGRDGLPKRNRARNQRVRCRIRLALKGNHETVHREVQEFLDATIAESKTWKPPGTIPSPLTEKLASHKTVEKDHGRIETREYYQSANLGWFADLAK